MRKLELKIIFNLVTTFLLSVILIISVSYGWYTNNKQVNANGISASSATEALVVSNQGAYRQQIDSDPYPEEDPEDDIKGVLTGDEVYFSISLTSEEIGKKKIDIKVTLLAGGEFFTCDPKSITIDQYESLGSGTKANTYTAIENNIYTVYQNDTECYYIKLYNQVYYKYTGTVINGQFTPSGNDPVSLGTTRPTYTGKIVSTYYTLETNVYDTYNDTAGKEYYLKSNFDGLQQIYIYEGYDKYKVYQEGETYFCIKESNGIYYKVFGDVNFETKEFTPNDQEPVEVDMTKIDLSNATYTEIKYQDNVLRRYNMMDVYTCDIYRIFGRRAPQGGTVTEGTPYYIIASEASEQFGFAKLDPFHKSRNMYPLYSYDLWTNDPDDLYDSNGIENLNCCDEITFTFRFTFDYTDFTEDHPDVNLGSLSNKKIEFNNILIYETEVE